MNQCVRVIIVHHQNILVMKRLKPQQEYYTLIGGGIEPGETADQAAIREADEETSLKIDNLKLVYIEDAGERYGTQYIFTADYVDGSVALQPSSIEAQLNTTDDNYFEPMWVPISKFAGLPFRSRELQQEILTALREGFPQTPKKFVSQIEK